VDSGSGNDFNRKFLAYVLWTDLLTLFPFIVAPSVEEIGNLNTVNDLINANVPVGANLPVLSTIDGSSSSGNTLNR